MLAMDRTTLTASIKPLERRGLMTSFQDDKDRRVRRLKLTDEGRDLLEKAVPIWRQTHDRIDKVVGADIDRLRDNLLAMTFALPEADEEISDPEP